MITIFLSKSQVSSRNIFQGTNAQLSQNLIYIKLILLFLVFFLKIQIPSNKCKYCYQMERTKVKNIIIAK